MTALAYVAALLSVLAVEIAATPAHSTGSVAGDADVVLAAIAETDRLVVHLATPDALARALDAWAVQPTSTAAYNDRAPLMRQSAAVRAGTVLLLASAWLAACAPKAPAPVAAPPVGVPPPPARAVSGPGVTRRCRTPTW